MQYQNEVRRQPIQQILTAIPNSLNLEYTRALGSSIEFSVQGLEELKNLNWFSFRAPGSETCDVSEHDSCVWE